MAEGKLRFGVSAVTGYEDEWRFGVGFVHFAGETYIYINLFRLFISIGKMYRFK